MGNAVDYKTIAKEARLKVLDMVYRAKSSHIGSNFSIIDILTVLFAKKTKDDQIILSAGWKAAAFYYFLSRDGAFPAEELDTYNQEGSRLIGLTEPGVPGVLFAGGSMQVGLPAAVGFALAKKIKGEPGRVYCIMSDGELAGGMVWESALIAAHHKLDNLVVIIDNNGLQAMGETDEILKVRFPQYGWHANMYLPFGNDVDKIAEAFYSAENIPKDGRPLVWGFNTIKGKGVSFMEGRNEWHYRDIPEDLYEKAKAELSV